MLACPFFTPSKCGRKGLFRVHERTNLHKLIPEDAGRVCHACRAVGFPFQYRTVTVLFYPPSVCGVGVELLRLVGEGGVVLVGLQSPVWYPLPAASFLGRSLFKLNRSRHRGSV